MSEKQKQQPGDIVAKEEGGGTSSQRRERGRIRKAVGWFGGVLAAVFFSLLMFGALGPHSHALSREGGSERSCGMRWAGFHRHGAADPERAAARARMVARWAVKAVDATDEQQEKVGRIVEDLSADLIHLAGEHHVNRDAMLAALEGPQVDRAALERLREAESDLFDRASRRLIEGLADASEVLTPEQRRELLETAREFHR